MAGTVIYLGMGRTLNQNAQEPLTLGDLADTRLDPLFCSCGWPGCDATWISGHTGFDYSRYIITNPRGGRCEACGMYACSKHFASGPTCRQCGADLDCAPPANGRAPQQIDRLNHPVVHVFVLREGPLPPSRDFVQMVLEFQVPDALEDGAKITAVPVPGWSDDPNGLAMAVVARDHLEYLGADFEMRSGAGRDQTGAGWAVVKVFKNTPKYVDPTVN
jgi:hypothetical protein